MHLCLKKKTLHPSECWSFFFFFLPASEIYSEGHGKHLILCLLLILRLFLTVIVSQGTTAATFLQGNSDIYRRTEREARSPWWPSGLRSCNNSRTIQVRFLVKSEQRGDDFRSQVFIFVVVGDYRWM